MNHLKDEEIISYYNHKLEQNEEKIDEGVEK